MSLLTEEEKWKGRLLDAIITIAENTAPKDKDLFEVTRERDQLKVIVQSLVKSINNFSYDLELDMDESDLHKRAIKIRATIKAMRDWAEKFKVN